jgi:small subunit ribosomal protein S27e
MNRWDKILPNPKSYFLLVKCQDCSNEMSIFSNVAIDVDCDICGAKLAIPTGGKSKILGEIIKILE